MSNIPAITGKKMIKSLNELPRRKQRGIRIKIDSAGSLGAIVDIPFLAFLHI